MSLRNVRRDHASKQRLEANRVGAEERNRNPGVGRILRSFDVGVRVFGVDGRRVDAIPSHPLAAAAGGADE